VESAQSYDTEEAGGHQVPMSALCAWLRASLPNTQNPSSFCLMPMTIDQIVKEARSLPQDARAELVERILLGPHGGIDPRVEESWRKETRRRVAEIESGRAKGIPLDDALAEGRKMVGL
jgi:putative addiction module component (TIGR02574 family)